MKFVWYSRLHRLTKLRFLQPNTTSEAQPLDAGIIADFKALFRKRFISHHLDQFTDGLDGTIKDGINVDIRTAIIWAA